MSLFDVRDFWSVDGETNDCCGHDCLTVGDINEDGFDEIIAGNYKGILRIFSIERDPDSGLSYKPSDLLMEAQLTNPILQVVVGLFVSGSRVPHIAVLHSRSVSIFNFSAIAGSVEHGNQFDLKIIYEHPLHHSCYQLICGQFGAVRNRDFLCAVGLDGTLAFFEQETFMTEKQLPLFLLPTPVVYVSNSDMFVASNADSYIEGYKYQMLVNTSGKKLNPAWSYNLGESVIDIGVVRNVQTEESFIVVLSERNLLCFHDNGCLRFTKRLQYSPLCISAYLNDGKNKIMTLLVAESGILLIYEETTLRWSAKLPFIPVAITKADLKAIKGALVILSENGDLKCCYLGTEPTLFAAPPLENSIVKYKDVGQKLDNIEREISARKRTNSELLSAVTSERGISIITKVSYEKSSSACLVTVSLQPSGLIFNLHVSLSVPPPFQISPNTYKAFSLCDKISYCSSIYFDVDSKLVAVSCLDIIINIAYTTKDEAPRVVRKVCVIPLKFVLSVCKTPKEFNEKIVVETNQPPLLLCTLFQEFVDEHWTEMSCNDESACFCFRNNPDRWVGVSLLKNYYGYAFTSDSLSTLFVCVKQTLTRCAVHQGAAKDKKVPHVFTYTSVPTHQLFSIITDRVTTRNEIKRLEETLEKLAAQYRLIQRRILVKLRDKESSSSSMQILYKDTYETIIELSHQIELKEKTLLMQTAELYATIEIVLVLLQMATAIPSDDFTYVRNALIPTFHETSKQGWEEVSGICLTYLLKTRFAVSSKDQLRALPDITDKTGYTDANRLKKLISWLFDRISRGSYKKDQIRAVSTILENDEIDDLNQISPKKEITTQEVASVKKSQSSARSAVVNAETVNWEWFDEV